MSKKLNPQIALLLQALDEAYVDHAWQGTNLRGSIRGLKAKQAAWRPGPDKHNIWEYIVHCAYWKYVVFRRITGEKKGSFPLKGSNFFPRPEGKIAESDWQQDIELLDNMHEQLHDTIAKVSSSKLTTLSPKKQWTLAQEIQGVAMHDVYHTGQIQLLKRMMKS
ncbi:MAG: DinB family protein [Ignavibacteriae bacterium]|nr:DinB family protein [Ignavibacteriota bacterium]